MRGKLIISLFGPCVVRTGGPDGVEIKREKHRALFALLATAPLGRRTRTYLQRTLWGPASYDGGRQNLRRALSDLRTLLGADFDRFLTCTNSDIELNLSLVEFAGTPGAATFLEDIDIRARGFAYWLATIRSDESQIAALYRDAPGSELGQPKPRITLMPLKKIFGDQNLLVLGDWLAEELCRSLSRSLSLSVTSHLSSRAMAARSADTADIRRTLEADYLLAGSLRDLGGRVIADMDFVDARDGNILWTRQIAAAPPLFWEVVATGLDDVVRTVGRSIADGTIAYVRDRPFPKLEDHRLVIDGVSLMHRQEYLQFSRSLVMLQEAVSRDPNAAETHAWIARWYALKIFNGWTTDQAGDTQNAVDAASRALDIDPENAFSLVIDGFVRNTLLPHIGVASQSYDSAIEINPNESLSWLLRGALLAFQDKGAQAIVATEKARALSPLDPFRYYYDSLSSTAHLAAEDYERALRLANASLSFNDRHLSTLRAKIVALHYLDRGDEARATAAELLRRSPGFSLEAYRLSHPAAKGDLGHKAITALTAAGIP